MKEPIAIRRRDRVLGGRGFVEEQITRVDWEGLGSRSAGSDGGVLVDIYEGKGRFTCGIQTHA